MKNTPPTKSVPFRWLALVIVTALAIGLVRTRDTASPPAPPDPDLPAQAGPNRRPASESRTNQPELPPSSLPPAQSTQRLASLAPSAPALAPPAPAPAMPTTADEPILHAAPDHPVQKRIEPQSQPPPASAATSRIAERQLRLQELLQEVAREKDPRQAQRTSLTIAGYHVGDGDWAAAREIYERLKTSEYPEIVASVARNLDVVTRNQAILAEPDAAQREWLQLQLAGVHQRYGHEQAAKRLLRSLEQSATQESVRQQAAQTLAGYVNPPLQPFQSPSSPATP